MQYKFKQNGVTLIELIVAIGIMAAISVGINSLINQYSEDTRASITALHLKRVGAAANEYIKDNYATLTGVATPTTPALIRVSDLVTGGYLTAGFAVKNPRNQDTCILVLEPTANNLTAIAVTEGGDTVDDLTLGMIASTIGGDGGGIYSSSNTTMRGAMGGYSLPIGNFANANHLGMHCDGVTAGTVALTVGHPVIALWFSDGNSTSSTLYRDNVPGNPSLNTMNTPIIMGAGTVQVADSPCTTIGMLGRDSLGKVLMCDGSLWKEQGSAAGYWKDPVATFASLPVCDAASASNTRVVNIPTVGSGPRAYTCNGAGSWLPLAVDDGGNLTVAGILAANSLTVSGDTQLGNDATDTVSVSGSASINKLSGNLEVTSVAVEGGACTPNGRIARNTNGVLLSCQSGIWKGVTSSAAEYVLNLYTSNTYSATNTYGKTLLVMASGGERNPICGNNGIQLTGTVAGNSVAYASDSNSTGYKTTSITFLVPAGAVWQVTSRPFGCAYGAFTVVAATM